LDVLAKTPGAEMMPKKPYKEKTHRTSRPTLRLSDETIKEIDRQIAVAGAKSRADYITALVHDAKSGTKRLTKIVEKLFGKRG